jgi:phosphoglycolate phosphatase
MISLSQIQKPKAVLFDWDNTVADTWDIIYNSLVKTFVAFGMEPWTREEVKAGKGNIHHSMRASFPHIFGDRWEEAGKVYFDSFLECHLREIKLLPDAEAMLKSLRAQNYYMAVVSNKTGKHLRAEVTHLNLDKYFDVVIGAQDAARDKPFADPIFLALEKSNIPKSEYQNSVLMIGDSQTDIEAALNAGVIPCLFADHSKLSSEILKNKIYSVPDHKGIINALV